MQALARRVVEAVARHVLAQPVAGVRREVELLRHRVPVEPHAVADAVRVVLEPRAVGVDARDIGVRVGRQADVARRADVEVELAVGPEGQVLPAVRQVARQDVVDHGHRRRVVEPVLDPLHLGDPRDLGDIERAVPEGHAVGQVEALGDRLDLARAALVDDRVDVAGHAARDEQRALVAPGHDARIVDPVRPQGRLEPGRELELVDRDIARRLGCRRLGDGCQRRILQLGRHALLPRRVVGGHWEGAEEEHRKHRDHRDVSHDGPPLQDRPEGSGLPAARN